MLFGLFQVSELQLLDEYEQYLIPRSLAEDVAISFPCSSHDTEYVNLL